MIKSPPNHLISGKSIGLIVAACGVLLAIGTPTWAATQYVTDRLVVSVREAPRDRAEKIAFVKTDEALELLEDLGEYAKVRTPDGAVGFIQQQYLTTEVPKVQTIARLEAEKERLQGRIADLEQRVAMSTSQIEQELQQCSTELAAARTRIAELERMLATDREELQQVRQDYRQLREDAGNVLAISEQRDRLQEENARLSASLATLETERDELLKKGAIKWFLAGAGVLFIGWLIGKLSGSRRRSSLL